MFGTLVPWRARFPGTFRRMEREMEELMGRMFPRGRVLRSSRARLVYSASEYSRDGEGVWGQWCEERRKGGEREDVPSNRAALRDVPPRDPAGAAGE
jgi:hypothetical protein